MPTSSVGSPGFPCPSGVLTVSDVVRMYCDYAARKLSPVSLRDSKRLLDAFCTLYGQSPVSSMQPWHLESWLNSHTGWKAEATFKANCGRVRACFGWAMKRRIIPVDPFIGISFGPGKCRRAATDNELLRLLRCAPGHRGARFRQAILFLELTGCRPGELAKTERRHLDLDNRLLVFPPDEHKTGRRTNKPRVIVLPEVAVRLCQYLLKRMPPIQRYVFVTNPWRGRSRQWNKNNLSLRIRRIRRRNRLSDDLTPYTIRHRWGTKAALHHPLPVVAEMLGHQSTRTSERYIHISQVSHRLRAVADHVARVKLGV